MNESKALTCLGVATYGLAFIVISLIVNGWALSILWSWFAVPIFDLPSISIVQAVGISTLVNFFKGTKRTMKEEKDGKSVPDLLVEVALVAILPPLFSLGFGWIIVQFM